MVSRNLEVRADEIATTHQGAAGTYARALSRLHEDGLIPAVLAKKKATHPDLYDRLQTAGDMPDYPRPAPAAVMAWHGQILVCLVGMLFAVWVIRMIQQ